MATGATEFIDITTADVFLEEIWSKKATIAREENLVFGKLFNREFEPELQRGQVIRVGNISNLATTAKTANTAVVYETVTETEKTITIDQYYYAAFAIEDIIKVQASINLLDKYSQKLGYALALQEDTALAGCVDDWSNTVGTLISGLSDDNILRADQYLNDALAPTQGRAIVISPAEKANWLGMDKFTTKEYGYGSVVTTGILGSIYGYPVYVSTNVEGTNAAGHDNAMFQREAVAVITQIQPKIVSAYDIDYLCDKVVASDLYGFAEMRDDHGVWMKGA